MEPIIHFAVFIFFRIAGICLFLGAVIPCLWLIVKINQKIFPDNERHHSNPLY